MPSSRARAISELLSIVKVTSPSTSSAASPASASAARVASAESWSSERPDSLENSVAPIPATAATPLKGTVIGSSPLVREYDGHASGDMRAEGHRAHHVDDVPDLP